MPQKHSHLTSNILLTSAAAIVIIAGVKSAAAMLVPFLLAVFIAIISMPIMNWLTRHKVPSVLSVFILLAGLLLAGSLLATFIGGTLNAFYKDAPLYESKLSTMSQEGIIWLKSMGVDIPDNMLTEYLNPGAVMSMITSVFNRLGGVLANTFLILFTVVFILLEASSFPKKIREAFGNETQAFTQFERFSDSVQQYLAIKSLVSLGTGASIGMILYLIGLDYAALWALIAFLLNYIPNIGSIIAAVPAVLIAIVQLGVGESVLIAVSYVLVNTIFGNVVEPRLMGRSLGLSTLVVFLSLVFWGWILGPVGMLLSVPLTMVVKIALESRPQSRWIAILMDHG